MLQLLTGTPDGVLHVAGDVRASFSPSPGPDGRTLLAFSDGTLLAWGTAGQRCTIEVLASGSSDVDHEGHTEPEALDDALGSPGVHCPLEGLAGLAGFASDLVTLEGRLRWIVHDGLHVRVRDLPSPLRPRPE